jgi:hypothetical protein
VNHKKIGTSGHLNTTGEYNRLLDGPITR